MFTEPAKRPVAPRVVLPLLRIALACTLAVLILWGGSRIHDDSRYGPRAAFSLLTGALFGVLLQRTRFCWFCNLRDAVVHRDTGPLIGIVAALIVGTLAYAAIFGAWIVDPSAGYLPPKAHIGPLSWLSFAGGGVFGLGMSLSGSCISAHLYRLGEGSLLAPVALAGVVAGFILGLRHWEWFYLTTLQEAPVIWLPAQLGYAKSVGLQVAVLLATSVILWRIGAPAVQPSSPEARTWRQIGQAIFVTRWPSWLGGGLIGGLGAVVLLRTQPLGVTAELHRISREIGTRVGFLPSQLAGIDGFRGCRAAAGETLFTHNALFILALIAGSFAAALLAGQFRIKREPPRAFLLAGAGGVLLGLGSVVALGCSIGTALSGVMASAASGWAFLIAMVAGVVISLPVRRFVLRQS